MSEKPKPHALELKYKKTKTKNKNQTQKKKTKTTTNMTNSSNKCDPPFRCQNQRVTTTTMEPPQLAVLHPQLAMQHPEAQPQRRASSNSNNPAPAVCPGKFIVPEFPELAINKLTHHFVFVWSIARRAIRMPAGLADCGTSFR